MDVLAFGFNTVAPVMTCVIVGVILRMRGLIDGTGVNVLSRLCFRVFLPVLTFNNILDIDFRNEFNLSLVMFTLCGIIAVAALLFAVLRPLVKDNGLLAACVHTGFRSNYLMFAIPLAVNMFGDVGRRVSTMLLPVAVLPFNLLSVTLMCMLSDDSDHSVRKIVMNVVNNPLIIASALGIVASLAGLKLPGWGSSAMSSIASATSPLCLILVGAQMKWEGVRKNAGLLAVMCSVRLIAVPLLTMAAAVALGFRGPELGAMFVLFASPNATSCAIMARHYNMQAEFTAQMVVFTTMFSAVTLFAGISILRYLQLF